MNEPQAAIRAVQLSKAFGGRVVLDAVDLEIASGDCVALTGVNGAGKTTLLSCLAAAIRPDDGEVRWFGRLAGHDVALHRSVGMICHESGLYAHLTLRGNLAFAAQMSGLSNSRSRIDQWLEVVGLTPYSNVFPTRLSRGMRQRLAIARALIHDPPLLLLDEPFSSLDAAGAKWLLTLLADLHDRGHTICFVTHEQETIQRLAQRVLELREGKIYDITATHDNRLPLVRAA
jgi:heme ABC exporter ATP-binding subunit CcmA